jgi:predicted outer membrane repeat protein
MFHRRRRMERRDRKLRIESLEDRRVLSAVTVSTVADVIDGNINGIPQLIANPGADGKISLREAITAANFAQDSDTITFDPAVFNTPKTINLTQGQLSISESVTIDASMLQDGIAIDAGGGTDGVVGNLDGIRIFDITDPSFGSAPPLVEFIGLTLTGADSSLQGGAIYSAARLNLQDCTIEDNAAYNGGGAILSTASLDIENCTVKNNNCTSVAGSLSSIYGGGGLLYFGVNESSINIHDSMIIDNSGRVSGGINACEFALSA